MGTFNHLYRLAGALVGRLGGHNFEPLPGPDIIRLLTLHPASKGPDLSCELTTTRLGDNPDYEALSYCWGNPLVTRSIQCDGRDFAVTANLFDALTRLRHPSERRTVWIDALCINQRDCAERNSQLLLMKQIYRRASQVAIWLGRGTETTGLVASMLRRLRDVGHETSRDTIPLEPTADLRRFGLPGHEAKEWTALRYFFRRPWFERAWVIQEAVNAPRIDVMCGATSLDWDDIAFTARSIVRSTMFATTDTARICRHIGFVDERREARSRSDVTAAASLLELLRGSRRCEATDPRDKVYGLYPLMDDASSLPPPDYAKPAGDVYRETAAFIVRSTARLDILGYAGAARHPTTRHLGLPSWVPDWHAHERAALPLVTVFEKPTVAYSPNRYRREREHWTELFPSDAPVALDKNNANVTLSEELALLTFNATFLDEVVALSDTIQPYEDSIGGRRIDPLLQEWPNGMVVLDPGGEMVNLVRAVPDSAFRVSKAFRGSNLGGPMVARADMMQLLYGRRVFRSREGRLGLVSSYSSVGDLVLLVPRMSVPVVVRPCDDGKFTLVGECFLAGFMGETHQGGGSKRSRTITLK